MAEVEQVRTAKISPSTDIKGKIIDFQWHLKKLGRKQGVIEEYGRKLVQMQKEGADLSDPESVKDYIANKDIADSSKWKYIEICKTFYHYLRIYWEPPDYVPVREIPFIPTEQELDELIAACGKTLAALMQIMKETAFRPGEAATIRWIDIDFERATIKTRPEKGSLPRIQPISQKLIEMLKNLPKKDERVFPTPFNSIESNFCKQRKAKARKLGNPRFLQITLYTFRHWKATMLYHETKELVYVQEFLGHKSILNTRLYVQIDRALFINAKADEFHVRIAKTPEQITEFLESGFEYILQKDNSIWFRKRK